MSKCKDCKYFQSEEYEVEEIPYETTYGMCNRYPPKRIDGNTSGFPMVEDSWFCGEFKRVEEES